MGRILRRIVLLALLMFGVSLPVALKASAPGDGCDCGGSKYCCDCRTHCEGGACTSSCGACVSEATSC
jgi:hypothetical protein